MATAIPDFHRSVEENSGIPALLDIALTETRAQGAYTYAFDAAAGAARLIAWSGLAPSFAPLPPELPARSVRGHFARTAPIVLDIGAHADPRFELPEFQQNRFEGVISVPLWESGAAVGMVNVCRSRAGGFQPRELSFLMSLTVPIAALITTTAAAASLRQEVHSLNRQLADRKLLERAKGMIQRQFEWTEEQAYIYIRNISRRRRIPVRDIAAEVIERLAAKEPAKEQTV